jgi:hypothetical protein
MSLGWARCPIVLVEDQCDRAIRAKPFMIEGDVVYP